MVPLPSFSSYITRFVIGILMFLMAEATSNTRLMSCQASLSTLRFVDRCPKTETEWLDSARRKNCSEISQNYSRTDFVYHCLINSWGNATVEVCVLRVNIIGKCAEFNIKGAVVQGHARRDCRSFKNPCPAYYKSYSVYLYQECFDGITTTKQNTDVSAATNRYIIAAKGKTLSYYKDCHPYTLGHYNYVF